MINKNYNSKIVLPRLTLTLTAASCLFLGFWVLTGGMARIDFVFHVLPSMIFVKQNMVLGLFLCSVGLLSAADPTPVRAQGGGVRLSRVPAGEQGPRKRRSVAGVVVAVSVAQRRQQRKMFLKPRVRHGEVRRKGLVQKGDVDRAADRRGLVAGHAGPTARSRRT